MQKANNFSQRKTKKCLKEINTDYLVLCVVIVRKSSVKCGRAAHAFHDALSKVPVQTESGAVQNCFFRFCAFPKFRILIVISRRYIVYKPNFIRYF